MILKKSYYPKTNLLFYSKDILCYPLNMPLKTHCKYCKQLLPEKLKYPNDGLKWKRIPNVDGLYYLSNTGKIYSTARQNYLKIRSNNINLYTKGKLKYFSLPRLVAQLYFPNYDKIADPFVEHLDGDRNNYHIDNLNVI